MSPPDAPTPVRRPRAALLVAAAALAVLLLSGCGSKGHDAGTGDRLAGKDRFKAACASCHTLADAGSEATIGPNLDDAFFQYRVDASGAQRDDGTIDLAKLADDDVTATVVDVVKAQIFYPVTDPPVEGVTGMPGIDQTIPICERDAQGQASDSPPGCVEDDDAQEQAASDIATYVGSVAGLLPPGERPSGGGGGGDETDGKSIFASAGCGGCHTLADAGAAGAVGPNLDELKPSQEQVATIVTNGRGGMPAFGDKLSEEQIAAVAEYVSSAAGK